MKLRLLTLTLVSALVALPVLRAQDAKKADQTELGDKMEKLNGAYRKLPKLVADAAQKDEALAQIAIIKASAQAALKLEPAKKAEVPAAEQAKFVADYQAKMKEFAATVDKLEAAVKAGDTAGATKIVDDMKTERNDAHKSFKKEDKKILICLMIIVI